MRKKIWYRTHLKSKDIPRIACFVSGKETPNILKLLM